MMGPVLMSEPMPRQSDTACSPPCTARSFDACGVAARERSCPLAGAVSFQSTLPAGTVPTNARNLSFTRPVHRPGWEYAPGLIEDRRQQHFASAGREAGHDHSLPTMPPQHGCGREPGPGLGTSQWFGWRRTLEAASPPDGGGLLGFGAASATGA